MYTEREGRQVTADKSIGEVLQSVRYCIGMLNVAIDKDTDIGITGKQEHAIRNALQNLESVKRHLHPKELDPFYKGLPQ